MIEVEAPWMETISDYEFAPNTTFPIDPFVSTKQFALRWGTGAIVEGDGNSWLSKSLGKIYELDF